MLLNLCGGQKFNLTAEIIEFYQKACTNFSSNDTLSTSFCPIGLGLGFSVSLARIFLFEIGLKVIRQKKIRTKRHGPSVIGRTKDHPSSKSI